MAGLLANSVAYLVVVLVIKRLVVAFVVVLLVYSVAVCSAESGYWKYVHAMAYMLLAHLAQKAMCEADNKKDLGDKQMVGELVLQFLEIPPVLAGSGLDRGYHSVERRNPFCSCNEMEEVGDAAFALTQHQVLLAKWKNELFINLV